MKNVIIALFIVLLSSQCSSKSVEKKEKWNPQITGKTDTATLAGGCFWCVEAALEQITGVYEVVSGYAGGTETNADYRAVSSGRTKHAEAVQVYFDPGVISYETILDIFFVAHDPTQLNRQGPDVGPQYRSAVFYHDEEQKNTLKSKIQELSPKFNNKIVTEQVPLTTFFDAEDYHQDYEKKHPYQPYILSVSKPKVDKVRKAFPQLLKEE